jgi:putative nucleotidyltransferase with HDIG domain
MKKRLLALIPEIQMIKEAGLRKKTETVWQDAVERSGWTIQELTGIPFTLLIPGTKINIIQHTRAVTQTSLKIAEVLEEQYGGRVPVDRDILLAGALLHDIGKLFEYRKDKGAFVKSREGELLRHPISGAAFAFGYGLPPEVVHIIAVHSREGEGGKRTVEAVIVHHADFVNFDTLKA